MPAWIKKVALNFLILLSFLLIKGVTKASNINLDSLLKVLPAKKSDTAKVNVLNILSYQYNQIAPVKGMFYARQSLNLAKKCYYPKGYASALNNIGIAHYYQASYDSAIYYYKAALKIKVFFESNNQIATQNINIGMVYSDLGNHTSAEIYYQQALNLYVSENNISGIANALNELGLMYKALMNYDMALAYLLQSSLYFEKCNDLEGLGYTYNNIGAVYYRLKKYDKALDFFAKCTRLYVETKIPEIVMPALNNIGLIYLEKKEYKKALDNYIKLEEIAEIANNTDIKGYAYSNMALSYLAMNDFGKALEFAQKSLIIRQGIGNNSITASSYIDLGNVYFKLGLNDKALSCYKIGDSLIKTGGNKETEKNVYEGLSEVLYATGDYKSAMDYYKKFVALKDTAVNEEGNKLIAEAQAKYETEKKAREIELLRKNNELISLKNDRSLILFFSLGSLAFLIIIVIAVIFYYYRLRQRHRQLLLQQEAEKEILESEKRFKDFANLLPQIVFESTLNKRFLFLNEPGLHKTGYAQTDIDAGLLFESIVAPENTERITVFFQQIAEGKSVKETELLIKNADQSFSPSVLYASPVIIDGFISGIRGIVIDISEIKLMERKILNSVVEAELNERKRFSEDLHDGLGPLLSGVKMYINKLELEDVDDTERRELLHEAGEFIDEAVNNTRSIAYNLMPSALSEKGLVAALNLFINKINLSQKINISFSTNIERKVFDPTTKMVLYKVLTELINNTVKHAGATEATISMMLSGKNVSIVYHDNGKGFDYQKIINDPKRGLGLNNILNRIDTLKGFCEIKTSPLHGFTTNIEVKIQ